MASPSGGGSLVWNVGARFSCMTFRDCINVLRKEIQVLPLAEREKVEALLDSGEGKLIVLELERLEASGRLSSPTFKATLKDLYWSSR
jgi:hypothetical protein